MHSCVHCTALYIKVYHPKLFSLPCLVLSKQLKFSSIVPTPSGEGCLGGSLSHAIMPLQQSNLSEKALDLVIFLFAKFRNLMVDLGCNYLLGSSINNVDRDGGGAFHALSKIYLTLTCLTLSRLGFLQIYCNKRAQQWKLQAYTVFSRYNRPEKIYAYNFRCWALLLQ